MKDENFKKKFVKATKWSAITEIFAKLVNPITNMILARLISPEAFGLVATVTMIISFVDMFTDAGFQKYLIQHEFKDEKEKNLNANVAFWTNFIISIILFIIIIIFRNQIAYLVGISKYGNIIAISSIQLLLTAFSSIQMALYRRDFDFKTLFLVRIIYVCIPFFVTVPLAIIGFSYWSIIIGSIVMQISNAIILTFKSKWKPKFIFSFKILKKMLSFSIWSLIEAISIWFTIWIDIFIIGSVLNEYYLGIYKISTTMVNAIMSLITASIIPVLFSGLSRLQNEEQKFKELYFKIQRIVSIFVFPLGILIYLYSDLATKIMLGDNWIEASNLIGIWAITSSVLVVFGSFASEVYRAKGRPKLSFLVQVLHLIFLIPVCVISIKYGFLVLVYARSLIRLQGVLVHFIIMQFIMGISISKTLKNVLPTMISAVLMCIIGILLKQINTGMVWDFISIAICIIFYFGVLYLFPSIRYEINSRIKKIKNKLNQKNI